MAYTGPTTEDGDFAANLLKENSLIIYPTETQYALGANPFSELATAKIFALKKRQKRSTLPLIGLLKRIREVVDFSRVDQHIFSTLENFWPAPLTLILPVRDIVENSFSSDVVGEGGTIAVRVSPRMECNVLASKVGGFVVSTSCNISGKSSAQDVDGISAEFQELCLFQLGPQNEYSKEAKASTIVSILNNKIELVREGGFSWERIHYQQSLKRSL